MSMRNPPHATADYKLSQAVVITVLPNLNAQSR